MSLIIALGSNLKDRKKNLNKASNLLRQELVFVKKSLIYESSPVGFLDQPFFLNQLIEFEKPFKSPLEILNVCLSVEKKMGRIRTFKNAPRLIDIDIIFWGLESYNMPELIIPHPEWNKRSFILKPLKDLPFYQKIKSFFAFREMDDPTLKIYQGI